MFVQEGQDPMLVYLPCIETGNLSGVRRVVNGHSSELVQFSTLTVAKSSDCREYIWPPARVV